MDSDAAKAAARAERLKQLQMEDLGSARREYISTSGIKRPKNVSMQSLEAARLSNMRGTDAQRTADANREKLSGWANVYKEIGDTDDLEHLDTLLDGQTHRLQLNAFVRGSGGQNYTQCTDKGKAVLKTAPKIPAHAGNSTGAGISKQYQRPGTSGSTTSAKDMGKEASMKHPLLARKPSVNFSRGFTTDRQKDREGNNQKYFINKGGFNKKPPALRTRRPAHDFTGEICSPESFLAAARSVYDPKSLQRTPVTGGSASNDHSGDNPPADAKQPPKKKLHTSLTESVHCPPDDRQARPESSSKPVQKSVLTGASTSLDRSIHHSNNIKPSSLHKAAPPVIVSLPKAENYNISHPQPAPDLRAENFAKEMKAHLNYSVHSSKNDNGSGKPPKTPAKQSQVPSTTSLGPAGVNIKEKASTIQVVPEPAAKPQLKEPPTSLSRPIHSSKIDNPPGLVEPSKTLTKHPQNELTTSLGRAGVVLKETKEKKTPYPKPAPAKPHSNVLPTSLCLSIHGPKNDNPSGSAEPVKAPTKNHQNELATPLNRSIHSPKNDNPSGSAKPLKTPAKHSRDESITSTSLGQSTPRPQLGKTHSVQTPDPVTGSEPKAALKPAKTETSVPTAQPKASASGATKPHKNTQKHGVLLDFNTTPTKSLPQKDDLLMSPALADLKGLDFAGPSPSPLVQTLEDEQTPPFPKRKIDFRAVSAEAQETKPVIKDVPSPLGENAAESEFQTNIDLLCKLLESTSLSEKQKESLQECKDELQSKISTHPQTPKPAKSQLDNTSANNTPAGNRSATLSPQSHLNVTSPVFVPRSSFENHRSPTRSLSSDSTQYTAPTERNQPRHIFGNHLLPGRRGRSDEPTVNNTGYSSPPDFNFTFMDPPSPASPDSTIFRPRRETKPIRITDPSGNLLRWSVRVSSSEKNGV